MVLNMFYLKNQSDAMQLLFGIAEEIFPAVFHVLLEYDSL